MNEMPAYIHTVKGRRFYLHNPTFEIEEIAHSLGMQCRFIGHCSHFYSIAEHCVLVSKLCSLTGGHPFEGLMHDAHEAYLNDMAAPQKRRLDDYRNVEHFYEAEMRKWIGLTGTLDPRVKRADRLALYIETNSLFPAECFDSVIHGDEVLKAEARALSNTFKIKSWFPAVAALKWKQFYDALCP